MKLAGTYPFTNKFIIQGNSYRELNLLASLNSCVTDKHHHHCKKVFEDPSYLSFGIYLGNMCKSSTRFELPEYLAIIVLRVYNFQPVSA